MQNLYVVHGRPAWSSQFLISCINASGKFSPLRYAMTGRRGEDSFGCVAWAVDKGGERLEGPEVTIGTAKAEGWFQKNGSKWKTMPELMLRYRAATLFARLFAPELTMGIQTDEEIIDVSPVVTDPVRAAKQAIASEPKFLPSVNLPKLATGLLNLAGLTEADLLSYMRAQGLDESLSTLAEVAKVAPDKLKSVCDNFKDVEREIKAPKSAIP
jgi:hypothetical protein